MEFEALLLSAKHGDPAALDELFAMFRPCLMRYSVIGTQFDEDLLQIQNQLFWKCIQRFQLSS